MPTLRANARPGLLAAITLAIPALGGVDTAMAQEDLAPCPTEVSPDAEGSGVGVPSSPRPFVGHDSPRVTARDATCTVDGLRLRDVVWTLAPGEPPGVADDAIGAGEFLLLTAPETADRRWPDLLLRPDGRVVPVAPEPAVDFGAWARAGEYDAVGASVATRVGWHRRLELRADTTMDARAVALVLDEREGPAGLVGMAFDPDGPRAFTTGTVRWRPASAPILVQIDSFERAERASGLHPGAHPFDSATIAGVSLGGSNASASARIESRDVPSAGRVHRFDGDASTTAGIHGFRLGSDAAFARRWDTDESHHGAAGRVLLERPVPLGSATLLPWVEARGTTTLPVGRERPDDAGGAGVGGGIAVDLPPLSVLRARFSASGLEGASPELDDQGLPRFWQGPTGFRAAGTAGIVFARAEGWLGAGWVDGPTPAHGVFGGRMSVRSEDGSLGLDGGVDDTATTGWARVQLGGYHGRWALRLDGAVGDVALMETLHIGVAPLRALVQAWDDTQAQGQLRVQYGSLEGTHAAAGAACAEAASARNGCDIRASLGWTAWGGGFGADASVSPDGRDLVAGIGWNSARVPGNLSGFRPWNVSIRRDSGESVAGP